MSLFLTTLSTPHPYLHFNFSQAFHRHSEWIIVNQPRIHEGHVARMEEMSENIPLKIPKEINNL
jgi:hypothetical protein